MPLLRRLVLRAWSRLTYPQKAILVSYDLRVDDLIHLVDVSDAMS